MTISEMILILQQLQAEHGDLPCYYYDDWNDFPVKSVKFHHGYTAEDGYPDPTYEGYKPDRIIIDDGARA